MGQRIKLHEELVEILGSENVYFQPPPTAQMKYPAIVYKWSKQTTLYADNVPYFTMREYTVTVIDRNPDSLIPEKLGRLPRCEFDRAFQAENLNHFVYSIHY